jgi:peptidoglycan hydrolase CwlO-like protein
MKNIIIFAIACFVISSCSTMESDAEKACDITAQFMENMPQIVELSMKAGIGDEDSKKEAQKELDELQASLEKIGEELESLKGKYDEEEFQAYLLENCEALKEMGKVVEGLEEAGWKTN